MTASDDCAPDSPGPPDPGADRPGTDPTASLPRVPELDALLRDLDDLRLSMSTDLTLTAAALDAGCPEMAGSVLDSDRAALLAFEQRALRHLAGLEAHRSAPVAAPVIPAPRRRSRAGRLAPAAPLVVAAAALLGVLGGPVAPPGAGLTAAPASTLSVAASYAELRRLALDGASADEVRRAAEQLHESLEVIVARAATDPVAAQQALAMLESETLVLGRSQDRDALRQVLAEAQALVARLRALLPPAPRTPGAPAVPRAPLDVRDLDLPTVPDVRPPVVPAAEPAPEPAPASGAPAPAPSPGPTPAPEPAPAGEPTPAPESTPQTSPGSPAPATPPPAAPGPGSHAVLSRPAVGG